MPVTPPPASSNAPVPDADFEVHHTAVRPSGDRRQRRDAKRSPLPYLLLESPQMSGMQRHRRCTVIAPRQGGIGDVGGNMESVTRTMAGSGGTRNLQRRLSRAPELQS